ncbi:hypothetical protein BJ742DRAFT_337986 [Cladochytrium replicatum]|nr:hypothetical protein BJ742DRAFT_337986 [Cladochytrium replicatum]
MSSISGPNQHPVKEPAEDIQALKALVADALATRGVLARIKAELRASVFLVLQESKTGAKVSLPRENQIANQLLDEQEGRIAVELVRDFLDAFELKSTLAVFEAEVDLARFGKGDYGSIVNTLGISESLRPSKSLLTRLVNSATHRGSGNLPNGSKSEAVPNGKQSEAVPNGKPIVNGSVTVASTSLPPPAVTKMSSVLPSISPSTQMKPLQQTDPLYQILTTGVPKPAESQPSPSLPSADDRAFDLLSLGQKLPPVSEVTPNPSEDGRSETSDEFDSGLAVDAAKQDKSGSLYDEAISEDIQEVDDDDAIGYETEERQTDLENTSDCTVDSKAISTADQMRQISNYIEELMPT